MDRERWESLKHGDKIRFIGKWNPTHIGDVDTVVEIPSGEKYIGGLYESCLWPIDEFDPADWEVVTDEK